VTLIVDASVAFKWFFVAESNAAEALAVADSRELLIAPEILVAEVCNAAWRAARLRRIDPAELPSIAAAIPRFFSELVGLNPLAQRAIEIAAQLDHPVYDCFYVALAETSRALLVTADMRLLQKLHGTAWHAAGVALADYRGST
jgi:predicted nucleic acid-binding protein